MSHDNETFVKITPRNKKKDEAAPTLCVTIPRKIEKALCLEKGDQLYVFTEGNQIIYQKQKGN
jgi:hypothetical protein